MKLTIRLIVWGLAVLAFGAAAAQEQSPSTPEEAARLARGTLLAPKAFRAAAQKVQPCLVRIEGFGGVSGSGASAGFQAPGEGPTTGLVVSADGYILTSTFNFIRKPPVITVVMPDGERKVARLLGRDETRKICVLKVDGVNDLPTPTYAPREEVRVGQWAIALGVGFGGNQPALTTGIVSAAHRISDKAVQTDANLSPANYGGPLVDLDGRVIGLCVPLSPQSREAAAGAEWYDSGIGFAIPLAENAKRIEALKQGKNFQPPFLGVQTKPAGQPPRGVQVVEVVADSPAAKAGLEKEDLLLAIDDVEPLDHIHFATLIGRYVAGDKAKLRYRRGEEERTAEIEFAAPPEGSPPGDKPAEPVQPTDEPPAR